MTNNDTHTQANYANSFEENTLHVYTIHRPVLISVLCKTASRKQHTAWIDCVNYFSYRESQKIKHS